MAHAEQQDFFESVKEKFPEQFKNVKILDVGSLDINGNVKHFFHQPYYYVGIDLDKGQNVDIVCPGHLFDSGFSFDVVVSAECFEHDLYYEKTLKNMIRLLRDGGLLIFTCASDGREEHGTVRTTPENAPFLEKYGEEWANYYKNLNEIDIRACIDVDRIFSEYEFSYNESSCDLYFWGIKRNKGLVVANYGKT